MAACVDDAATVATTPLSFIADAALRESIRLDMSGAHRDLGQDEWKGATVLAGSAIEALLLWALQERERNKPGDVPAAVAALIGSKTLKGNPGAECRVPERSEQYLRSESLWRRQGDQADTIDKYQLRRRNLGRYSNVSPRFAAERDGEKKPIEAELRAVLREMTTEQPRKERRTGEASSHEYEFDANHWAHRLVERVRRRVSPPPRPLAYMELVESGGRSRGIGGDEWWNVAVARKMLFGDNLNPRGPMDALPVATAMRWLLTQLYGHGNALAPGSWTTYVKASQRDIARDLATIRRLRRRKQQR